MRRGRPRHPDVLTPREWQVLDHVKEGLTNSEIAVRLHVSPETVKTHVAEILSKLDVGSRQEAVAWAEGRERLGLFGLLALPLGSRPAGIAIKVAAVGALAVAGLGAVALFAHSATDSDGALGKLAYIQDGNLWVNEMPDGQPTQLTFDGEAWNPMWSSSGEWLSEGFTVGTQPSGLPDHGINVMRSDGSQSRYAAGCYGWLPVDDMLLCTKGTQFWVETPDGIRQRGFDLVDVVRKTSGREIWGGLCYRANPDGERVGCHVFGDPAGGDGSDGHYSALWVVGLDGQNARELYGTDVQPGEGWIIASGWLDENNAVFTLTNPTTERCWLFDCTAPGVSVYQVSAMGDTPPRLVGTTSVSEAGWSSTSSSWLLTDGTGPQMWANKRIVKVDSQGLATFLTEPGDASTSASWSPDGSQILYVSAQDAGELVSAAASDGGRSSKKVEQAKARRHIWLMDRDGSKKRPLTDDDRYRDERPQWSRDGEHVVFMRFDAESQSSVWTMSLENGNVYKVADVSPGISPGPRLAMAGEFTREGYFYRWFDYFGQVPQWLLYSWWQPQ